MPVTEGQMLFDSTYVRSQSNQIRGDRKIDQCLLGTGGGRRGEGGRGLCVPECRASGLEDAKHLGMDSSES